MRLCCELECDSEAYQTLHNLIREQLRQCGIHIKGNKKRNVFPVTPMRPQSSTKKVFFGRPLRDLAPNTVVLDGYDVIVPHFLSSIIEYLKQHLETEGLFRKPGSSLRQKSIKSEIEKSDTFCAETDDGFVAPLDAACILKSWLRELIASQEPLIPFKIQNAMISAATTLDGDEKTEAILLCCLLLPPRNAACLAYLFRFLAQVVESKDSNKMDAHNIAVVFAPSLFSVEGEDFSGKNVDNKSKSLESKLDIIKILIDHATRVCMIDDQLEAGINLQPFTGSEENLDADIDFLTGPSERRRKKKKRRSGSLSRVLTATMKGLHKAISRSTTPSGLRSTTDGASSRTPFELASPAFAVPSSKRRAPDFERESSPSKQPKSSFEASLTPMVVRHRSISIKSRFRRKKSAPGGGKHKDVVAARSLNSTPLPSKPTLASLNLISATPGTPTASDSFLPIVGQDLSIETLEKSLTKLGRGDSASVDGLDTVDGADRDAESITLKEIERSSSADTLSFCAVPSASTSISCASSRTSLASQESGIKRHSIEKRRQRSPSERKIGLVRGKSHQDLIHKDHHQKSTHLANVATFDIPDESAVRSRLRRGHDTRSPRTRGRPSPVKPNANRAKAQKDQIPHKNLNESLTNLRHDISHLIENSFGGKTSDKVTDSVADDSKDGVTLQKMSVSVSSPQPVGDFIRVADLLEPPKDENFALPPPVPFSSYITTRSGGQMRRQSSAFEFSRVDSEIPKLLATSHKPSYRRQSSAFEIADAASRREAFERSSSNRVSLKHRNSSVKDLVKKLESNDSNTKQINKRKSVSAASLNRDGASSLLVPEVKEVKPAVEEKQADESELFPGDAQFEEEWIPAAEFFSAKPAVVIDDDVPSGCKRSSIIRIRNERKGIVSKSIETFTKPTNLQHPGLSTPSRGRLRAATATPSGSAPRRTSARMGVATSVRGPRMAPPGTVSGSGVVTRRQTLTGIRTTPQHTARRTPLKAFPRPEPPKLVFEEEPIYENVNKLKTEENHQTKTSASKTRILSDRRHDKPVVTKRVDDVSKATRKSKRVEERRYLTIGYPGEVRSPFKERQNVQVTVQRSKSAQTPKPKSGSVKKIVPTHDEFSSGDSVLLRSNSMRSPKQEPVVPVSLRGTIYDVKTPKSEKVRRNLSDRVATPKGGRLDAAPFMKSARSSARSKKSLTPGKNVLDLKSPVKNSPRVLRP